MLIAQQPANYRSRETSSLRPDFADQVELLIRACRRLKLTIVPFSARRGPLVQGRMWCQSRTLLEVQSQRRLLVLAGARTLASCLKDEWASTGRWVTDRLPGQSWHQWGEACDFFIEVGGKAIWTDSRYATVMGKAAKDLGLAAGSLWPRLKDQHHVQMRLESTPNLVDGGTAWEDIEYQMRRRYSIE